VTVPVGVPLFTDPVRQSGHVGVAILNYGVRNWDTDIRCQFSDFDRNAMSEVGALG
jgi:hypothetical protein